MREKQRDARLLRPGMFAGLKFDKGWWFIQVIGNEYVEFKPHVLPDSDGNKEELTAQEAGDSEVAPLDNNNNLPLEPNDDERNSVFQLFYGVAPSRMQVFSLWGRERNVSLQNWDQPGEPAAYVSGLDSPYNNPSRESEVFYVNSASELRFQAYNPMDEAAEARMSFHVNKLRYTTVTDKNMMKVMLQGQQPARLSMMGEGIQDRDQVAIPNWLKEAFGEHIHTTEEILGSGQNGGGIGDNISQSASELEGIRGG